MALKGALICDRGGGRAAVADLEMEALADRFAVRVGGRDRDRVVAEIAVGRCPEITPVWALMLRPVGKEAEKVRASPAAGAAKWPETLSEKAWPSNALWFAMAVAVGPLSPTARWKLSLIALPWASVAVTVTVLLPKSLSVGVPEMTPVWASMLRPVGSLAEKVRASPAAGAAKWLETLSEKAWPSLALWFAMAVAVGPLSPTARWKLSLIALPWASVAVTVTVLLPKSLSVGVPEMTPVWASMLRPVGSLAEKVRASPAAGAAKWLETLSEKAWPSLALWFAMAVAVGPLSPTARLKLSLIALPWASVAVTVIGGYRSRCRSGFPR